MSQLNCISAAAVAMLIGGCGLARPTFTPQGLHQEPYGYDIAYRETQTQQFLSEDWRLDNYYKNSWSSQQNAKETPPYVTEYGFDTDGDGKVNTTQKQLAYDLRFENRVTAGVIWLRAVPLDQYDDRKDLRVLMRNWINSVAGADVDLWKMGDRIVVTAASYATKQLDEAPAKLAGLEAFASTFELANSEQLRMSPDARLRRVKLVMVRSGLVHQAGPKSAFPILMVAGVSDLPEYFEKSVVEFHKFLNQITIRARNGFAQSAPIVGRVSPDVAAPPAPSATPSATDIAPQ